MTQNAQFWGFGPRNFREKMSDLKIAPFKIGYRQNLVKRLEN